MKKKQMCVDFHAYLSGVTHMRQEFTVCQIKSHFSIVCRFYLFSLILIVDYLLTPSVSNGLTHDDGTPAIEEHPLSDRCRRLAYLQRTLSDGYDDDPHDGIGAPLLSVIAEIVAVSDAVAADAFS